MHRITRVHALIVICSILRLQSSALCCRRQVKNVNGFLQCFKWNSHQQHHMILSSLRAQQRCASITYINHAQVLVCVCACICQHSHHHTARVCKPWSLASWSLPCLLHAPACNTTCTSCCSSTRSPFKCHGMPQLKTEQLTAGQYHGLVLSA
jgi:hypothetical protein